MSFSNVKIRTQLILAFGFVIFAFVGLAVYAWNSIHSLEQEWTDFDTHVMVKRVITTDITRNMGEAIHMQKNFVLHGGDFDQKFFKSMDAIDVLITKYRERGVSPEEATQLNRFSASATSYRGAMKNLQQVKASGATDLAELDNTLKESNKPMIDAMAALNESNRNATVKKGELITNLASDAKNWLVAVAAPITLLMAGFGLLLARTITRPLRQAIGVAEQVAAGDLTSNIRTQRTDEIGELLVALKSMNESLKRIVRDVRAGTDMMASASAEIVSGNTNLSQRTEEQAASLEETAASIEEFTTTVKQNADNAKLANQLAASASNYASKGGEVVSRVVATMGSINQSSRKIVDIISVIDGIAFQTNILALNAAVEAARAGEQGRGFAVVAAEVRSLAQRSAAAAKEIKGLIGDSVDKVDTGTKLVDEAGKAMQEILVGIQQVTEIMSEIAAASQEQHAGIEQVNQAIIQMDKVTQQNAALVEESAAAAESMQEHAHALAESVRVFRLDAAAAAVAEPAPEPAPQRPVVHLETGRKAPALADLQTPAGTRKNGDEGWKEF